MEAKMEKYESAKPEKFKTCLSPDFDHLPPEQIYKEYKMEVPEEVMDFCRVIEEIGGRVLLVGGCVRDTIISKQKGEERIIPKDIDMEVYGIYPNDLLVLVKEKFIPVSKGDTVGNKFELMTVRGRNSSLKFDISIAREDNKTGVGNKGFETHSHPEFSIKDGARRRDLTCNSMAYDPLTKITYDPFMGRQDILDGILRATDEEKFIEDPVRILRLMRFAARYDWKIAPETEALCIWMMDKSAMQERQKQRYEKARGMGKFDLADEILDKSAIELDDEVKERVWTEFSKMFKEGGKPSIGLEFIRRVGVLDRYFPWLAELTVTEQEYSWHKEGNAWKHTLQVIDAAVEIAKRENLSDEETLELVVASLSHDIGKPTTTRLKWKEVNGEYKEAITSDDHDMEGGWLSPEFINAFAPIATIKILRDEQGDYSGLKETGFENELKTRVRILTEKHMQLKAWYLDYVDLYKTNPNKAERRARKSLGKLARELAEKGTNIFMLSFVTEADQRGRNGESNRPLEREEVKDLIEWQTWLSEMMKEVKIEKKLPQKIVDGEKLKAATQMKQGVELGVVDSWVFDDQLAGEFTNPEEGLKKARGYMEVVMSCVKTASEVGWKPRQMLGKNKFYRLEDEVSKWLKEDGVREKVMINPRLALLEKMVEMNTERVAELGEWPEYINRNTLTERVPKAEGEKAPGFDAGVACALGLIPEDKQKLAATLHTNYSINAVEQVKKELAENDPDSPATWWLAACAICKEGDINAEEFLQQIDDFKVLAADPGKRLDVAQREFEKMKNSFGLRDFGGAKNIPFGTKDGCMQAAYIAGHSVAVMYAEKYGVYFVGTYLPSLGLDGFEWSDEKDKDGNVKSGPVYGSKQFVKCADLEELKRVMEEIQAHTQDLV